MKIRYIAAGFRHDVENLLSQFLTCEPKLRFTSFAKVWNQMRFSYIFYGRQTENELDDLVSEMFSYLLTQFSPQDVSFERRVGTLYLLYSLYVKQPKTSCGFTNIRVTYENFENLRKLMEEAKEGQHYDVCYVWYKLLSLEAVHFVHVSRPLGPAFIRNTKVNPEDRTNTSHTLVHDLYLSMVQPINELSNIHELYRNMKEAIIENESSSDGVGNEDGINNVQESLPSSSSSSSSVVQAMKGVNMVQDNLFEILKVKLSNLKKEYQMKTEETISKQSTVKAVSQTLNHEFEHEASTSGNTSRSQSFVSKTQIVAVINEDEYDNIGSRRLAIKDRAMKRKPNQEEDQVEVKQLITQSSSSVEDEPRRSKRGRPKIR